ncbi:hypothetical protein PBRA_004956 [Plasmodiophora brassicae]|uniref:Major facilitator superfamily (MFS) profile domain-containing protein n=1 Tax=Plasmodiophora brassicae TaxID=37360 RepID=A0A0G4IMF6_PLABS|nr:hypothetical protein PBRA_004956 [Plasmodiophora brassicae]
MPSTFHMLLWTSLVLHVAGYPRCVPSPEIEMPEGHENTHFSREFDFQTRTHSLRGIAVPTMIYGTPTSCCGIILLLSVVSTTAGDGSDRDTTDWVAVSTPTESRSISLGHAPPHERSSWQRLTESNKDEEEITTDEMMKSPKLFSPVVRLLTAVACVEGLYRAFVMPIFPIHLTQHGYTPMEIAVLLSVFPFAGVITSMLLAKFMTSLRARRRAIQISLITQATLAVLIGVIFRSKAALFIVYAMLGVMTQVNMNVALAIISQVFTGDETVNVCGIYRGAMAIGILLGPGLSGFMYDQGGFVLPFAVLGGITSLAWLLSLMPIKQLQDEIDKRIEDGPVPSGPVECRTLVQRVLFALNVFMAEFAMSGSYPTLSPFLERTLGLSSSYQGLLITGNAAAFLIGAILSTKVNRKFGARASPYNSPLRLAMAIVSIVVLCGCQAPWVVVQHPYLSDAFGIMKDNTAADEKRMGYVAAVFSGMMGAADTVGPVTAQAIVDQSGFSTLCVASTILMLAWALIVLLTFPNRVRDSIPPRRQQVDQVPHEA